MVRANSPGDSTTRPGPTRVAVALTLGLALVVGAGSCVSLEHAFDPETDFEVYGGVQSSWAYMSNPDSDFWGTFFRFIDFPLTVVMDTLLLPVSIPIAASR